MGHYHAPFDLLQWLPEEAQKAFLAATRSRHLPAKALIYAQSDPGDDMFRLVSGSVRLSVMGPDGRELLYELFGPGDCFGTSSLVDGEPRPQTAEAFDAIELQVINRKAVNELRAAYPAMNDALLKLLSRHMRLLSDYFAGAALDEVALRLAQRLVTAADGFGVHEERGVVLSGRLSQSELASMVGTARQTVNRILQTSQKQGLVAMDNGAIIVTDLSRLRSVAHQGAQLRGFAA